MSHGDSIEGQIDRTLALLRQMIRQQGYTHLEVQSELGWGRSYISQLFTKQKHLRFEQLFRILGVIGVEPADFFAELYGLALPTPTIGADTAHRLDRLIYLLAAKNQLTTAEAAGLLADSTPLV